MYCLQCRCVYRRILESQTKGVLREETTWPWRTMTSTRLWKVVMLAGLQLISWHQSSHVIFSLVNTTWTGLNWCLQVYHRTTWVLLFRVQNTQNGQIKFDIYNLSNSTWPMQSLTHQTLHHSVITGIWQKKTCCCWVVNSMKPQWSG